MRALDGRPAPITSVWPRLRHLSRVRRQNASVASDQRGTMNSGKIRTRAGDSAALLLNESGRCVILEGLRDIAEVGIHADPSRNRLIFDWGHHATTDRKKRRRL